MLLLQLSVLYARDLGVAQSPCVVLLRWEG